jgi:hypothetical protein
MKMKTGKITAKLRDAAPVSFMVDGEEVGQYKNIEIPDALKEIEMRDFHFDISADGKITFQIHYEDGVLPEVFPESRPRMTRAGMTAAKAAIVAAKGSATVTPDFKFTPNKEGGGTFEAVAKPEDEKAVIVNISAVINADEETPAEDEKMEVKYNVTGDRRKELVAAVGDIIGWKPVYKAAPSFAFAISNYIVDKNGTLTGAKNQELLDTLAERGFVTA